jgi:hypothetical protein
MITVNLFIYSLIAYRIALEPVLYEELNVTNTSHFIFNVNPQSDFNYIESICSVSVDQTFPCSKLTVQSEKCSTTLEHNGILGCDYECVFVTRKTDYTDMSSNFSNLSICEYFIT